MLTNETVSSHVCIETRAERQQKVTTKPGKTVNINETYMPSQLENRLVTYSFAIESHLPRRRLLTQLSC